MKTIIFLLFSCPCFFKSTAQVTDSDSVLKDSIVIEDIIANDPEFLKAGSGTIQKQNYIMPKFNGDFKKFIDQNFTLDRSKHKGKALVYVHFSNTGKIIGKPIFTKSVSSMFDKEILRILALMPNWIPAKDGNGKSMEIWTTVKFIID